MRAETGSHSRAIAEIGTDGHRKQGDQGQGTQRRPRRAFYTFGAGVISRDGSDDRNSRRATSTAAKNSGADVTSAEQVYYPLVVEKMPGFSQRLGYG